MTERDLADVERVADIVHPAYPEDAAVMAERLRLYPAGCLVLEGARGIEGYVVSHPWLFGRPPALNTRLGRLPGGADTFYLHDLALLPGARGGGYGARAVGLLVRQARAEGFGGMSLVAVGRSEAFWRRNGFVPATPDPSQAGLATYGGATFMARVLA